MKKILLFLILLFTSFITVNAQGDSFFEGEYIDNIYMNRLKDNIIDYQQARIFRHSLSFAPVYCIEPYSTFNKGALYYQTDTPPNLTQEQIEKIKLISYYGWGYKEHTDQKWYAITQFMIWEASYPYATYYFSDTLGGPRVIKYTKEINEINNLINNHKKQPSFETTNIIEKTNKIITLTDKNNSLENYQVTSNNASIENNKLIIKNLNPGTHTISLKQKLEGEKPSTFYVAGNSQNLVTKGHPDPITTSIEVIIQETKLSIKKLDKDTKTNNPQPNTSLTGAVFELYKDNKLVKKFTLDKTEIELKDLDYGNYYLKEKEPGKGYQLNENKYNFEITKEKPQIEITIENEVIKKEIEITKLFGTEENFKPEENINFNIYDEENNLIKTIITNKDGKASITLPYGKYIIKQMTTTEGFEKIEPITIEIKDTKKEEFTLKDYKIPVPDTYKKLNIFEQLWLKLKSLFF